MEIMIIWGKKERESEQQNEALLMGSGNCKGWTSALPVHVDKCVS